ncbi:glycoside hydrolase family 47 protein [Cucurbitaria berberidis CBS 394.84]|uniref:alpha-1,2-Mannosidase n=1 Tax=Cucurbitaria berberidis CBS 394.84 TaxID=1168544 RepID=A0A9P4L8M0_9PLEO|nr:glycoside hydrolase family 47 protein [Cucurbitaria berberidis CBS 394.84]KAF1845467.1 glycoside hydrolase family 47 protein [Cucurbitaria berberidis CBS 394.84]
MRNLKVSPRHLPIRSRINTRFSGLLLFIFIYLLHLYHPQFSLEILPSPLRFPSSPASCPIIPPYPSITSSPNNVFNWRNITQHYPVEAFEQLPAVHTKTLARIQHDFDSENPPLYHELMRKRRQAAIKATFSRCWGAYKELAWKQDELLPISGSSKTTFGGWGATLVDSLDTLWIMNMKDEFNEAVAAVAEIDFVDGDGELNMFETTIRYLGGLLSAYDLTECKEKRLLQKAMELGDMIYASFDTPNRMPVTRWVAAMAVGGEVQEAAQQGVLAELASFSLEFTRLSQLTGDMRYYDATTRVIDVLARQQNETRIPGLWPVGVNLQTPDLTKDTLFSLGTMADSAYEYLPKTYQILHGAASATQYKSMYETATEAMIQHLLFRPITPDNADILAPTSARVQRDGSIVRDHSVQHLSCFTGGMFALGAKLFQNASHLEYARRVTESCIWSYDNAPNGIMPEIFTMLACSSASPSNNSVNCTFNPLVWPAQQFPGFETVIDARYMLRPEAIESVFYMYRITGESRYQDVAWKMFQQVERRTRTEFANAAIRDVTRKMDRSGNGGTEDGWQDLEKVDSMESFWLAETLKYFYLVFSDPGWMSLDEWVFNTEAHPFRL